MDADTDIYTGKVWVADQNGVQGELGGLREEDIAVVVDGISDLTMVGQGTNASQETVGEFNDNKMVNPSPHENDELTNVHVENDGSPGYEEVEATKPSAVKTRKPQNSQGKIGKPTNAKTPIVKSVKTNNSSKEVKTTSNGVLPSSTRPKQPIAKARSFNDRHATNSNPSKTAKPVSATSNPEKVKVARSELTSDSDSMAQGEGSIEKSRLKPLRKDHAIKIEGDGESVESPTASEGKSLREGKLPSYGFSFRCHERAEKRREFYTKLEEKIQAKEMEKNNLQEKSKETLEAELKMLRKSLNFKATPMPTFYQEPAPPKAELKKIPTTRPRSPKLGRKKNTSSVEAEENDFQRPRPGRLSLDEKAVSRTNASKVDSPVQPKRPQRKSLPKLPSEKTRLSKNAKVQDKTVNVSPPIARVEEEEEVPISNPISAPIARVEEVPLSNPSSAPIAHVDEEVVETTEPGRTDFKIENNGPLVEDKVQLSGEQEIVLEH